MDFQLTVCMNCPLRLSLQRDFLLLSMIPHVLKQMVCACIVLHTLLGDGNHILVKVSAVFTSHCCCPIPGYVSHS
uniref:Uncharacterized protein n=1 Tax=Arundo donax TaxID=35708 RepID=A0A0A9HN45_ARUDO